MSTRCGITPLPLDSGTATSCTRRWARRLATGYCEIWFDGVKQTLTNGKDRIPCAMSRPGAGSHWKWGVYRSGAGGPIGQSVHYLQHPMLGTTYEDVAGDGRRRAVRRRRRTLADASAPATNPADAALEIDPAVVAPDAAAPGKDSGSASGGRGGTVTPPPDDDAGPSHPPAKSSGCAVARSHTGGGLGALLLAGAALLSWRRRGSASRGRPA